MDKYYVYRPLLDLIGQTEGTDRGDGYNETLAYGKFTGGDVVLTDMTLGEIDKLQTKMLRHPKNSWKSSAIGRYQIVRTTLREIKKDLGLSDDLKYDEDMQDRLACYLLGKRGIDKYLAGRLKENTMINNLAMEWASFPTTSGTGYYGGQNAAVSPMKVQQVLAEVDKRHEDGQPKKKVMTSEAPDRVKRETDFWGWAQSAIGGGVAAFSAWSGAPWQTIAAFACVGVAGVVLLIVVGPHLARTVRNMQEEFE